MMRYEVFNPHVAALIPADAKVLDVGCATGELGRRFAESGASARFFGIERDPAMAERAARWYETVAVADIEQDDINLARDERFDIIVCADVLEHMAEPVPVLRHLSEYLAEEGTFLISVPNVAFISVRLSLLLGKFEYRDSGGIMDRGHVRFFTIESMIQTLAGCGLETRRWHGYSLVRNRYAFLRPLARIWPRLFAIQFLIVAAPVRPEGATE